MEGKIGFVDDKGQTWEIVMEPTFDGGVVMRADVTFKVSIPDQIPKDQREGYIRWKCALGCGDTCILTGFDAGYDQ